MMNTLPSGIVSELHPLNADTIWRNGNYSAFYQSASGNFLDIAVRFWKNNGELVAHVGTAVHRIVDGVEHDIVTSVILHSDGRLTNVGHDASIIQSYIPISTLYLLLNPTCYSEWTLLDRDKAMQSQEHLRGELTRDSLAAGLGMRPLPPLEETSRFDQLQRYMERLQGVYSDISNQ